MAKAEYLTDVKLRKMKTPKELVEIRDSSGVIFRHFTDGKKVFGWRFVNQHAKGKKDRIEYGAYPFLSLEHARQIHTLTVSARQHGEDILDNSVRAKIYKEVMGDKVPIKHQAGMTLTELFDRYIKEYIEANDIGPRPYNRIKNHVLPKFGDHIAETIPVKEIQAFVIEMRADVTKTETTVVDTIRLTSNMYNFAIKQFWINKNPFAELGMKRKKGIRKTYYSMIEIKRLLLNPDSVELGYDYHLLHKAILFSGCRRTEIMHAEIKEFDFDGGIWTIPADRLKNQQRLDEDDKEPFQLPMSEQFASVIKEAIQGFGNDTHVFGGKTNGFIEGRWQKAKTGSASERNFYNYIKPYREHYGVGDKNNHDLRRTLETTLNNLGVSKDITTAMTGHSKQGMDAVYNQAQQIHVMRTAFQLYADFIDFLCANDDTYCHVFKSQKLCPELRKIYQTFNYQTYLVTIFDKYNLG